MPCFSCSRSPVLAAVSTALLSVVTLVALHSQPVRKAARPPADSARQVADELDAIVQARFQDTKLAVFGTSRLGSPVIGHSLDARTPAEAKRRQRVAVTGRPYIITFLHCAPAPDMMPDRRLPPLSARAVPAPYLTFLASEPQKPLGLRSAVIDGARFDGPDGRWENIAISQLPRLLQGKPAQATDDDWLVVMRPVRALQNSCLSCHTSAKHGDTLGVMVYAVSKTAPQAAKP